MSDVSHNPGHFLICMFYVFLLISSHIGFYCYTAKIDFDILQHSAASRRLLFYSPTFCIIRKSCPAFSLILGRSERFCLLPPLRRCLLRLEIHWFTLCHKGENLKYQVSYKCTDQILRNSCLQQRYIYDAKICFVYFCQNIPLLLYLLVVPA